MLRYTLRTTSFSRGKLVYSNLTNNLLRWHKNRSTGKRYVVVHTGANPLFKFQSDVHTYSR